MGKSFKNALDVSSHALRALERVSVWTSLCVLIIHFHGYRKRSPGFFDLGRAVIYFEMLFWGELYLTELNMFKEWKHCYSNTKDIHIYSVFNMSVHSGRCRPFIPWKVISEVFDLSIGSVMVSGLGKRGNAFKAQLLKS